MLIFGRAARKRHSAAPATPDAPGTGIVLTAGGFAPSATDATSKYNLASAAVSAGTVLSSTVTYLAGTGIPALALLVGGSGSSATRKYAYSGDTVSAGTALASNRSAPAAAGNLTLAVVSGGLNGSPLTSTDKYTYAGDVRTAGTAITTGRNYHAGVGSATAGLHIGGADAGNTNLASAEKYTYAGDAVSAGTSLTTARRMAGATGGVTVGVISAGFNGNNLASTERYTYSNDAVAAGISLGTARFGVAAAGNAIHGMFTGGYTTAAVTTVEQYSINSGAVVAGTVLGTATYQHAAASSNPGWLVGTVPDAPGVPIPGDSVLLHLDGADGSTTFTDAAGHTFAANAGATISVSFSGKFGGASANFFSTSGYITTPDEEQLRLGGSDWCIEGWVNKKTDPTNGGAMQTLVQKGVVGSTLEYKFGLVNVAGSFKFRAVLTTDGATSQQFDSTNLATLVSDAYQHWAVSKQGTTLRFFLGGVAYGTATVPETLYVGAGAFAVGAAPNGVDQLKCYADEVRVRKGEALYTAAFTPPSAAYTYKAPVAGVTAAAGDTQATVSFLASVSDGGSAITGYTVEGNPGGTDSQAGTTSLTHLMTGLTNGTPYSFRVKATNTVGDSPWSAYSNSVTPVVAPVQYALFAGGHNGAGLTINEKYAIAGDTVSSATALDVARQYAAAASNSTVGVFFSGLTTDATTTKYTHADGSVAASTTLTAAQGRSAGAGTATTGYVFGGFNSARVTTVTKYTYTGGAIAAGTALSLARYQMPAAGDTVRAIIAGGDKAGGLYTNDVDKYTYAGDVRTLGTALGNASYQMAGCSCATFGLFSGGSSASPSWLNTNTKYTYANDSMTAGTTLSVARHSLASASSPAVGLIGLGNTQSSGLSAVVDKYNFSNDARSAGTSLTTARQQASALSSLPGGIY